MAPLCNALLNKNQPQTPRTATVDHQRAAGKVVTISYLLGTRFALAPEENIDEKSIKVKATSDGAVQANDTKSTRSALAIAAYRQCQKKHALERLALLRTGSE